MMDKMHDTDDMVSALADGQLRGEAFARAVEALSTDAAARERWHLYHVIGDSLRSPDMAPGILGAGFAQRVQARLQKELTPVAQASASHVMAGRSGAANDAGGFRWKLVAGVASLAVVGAAAWNLAVPQRVMQPELARATPAPTLAVPPQSMAVAGVPGVAGAAGQAVMIRDPRLDEMLAAHRQAGGASALQMPSGFLRNATFDVPDR